MTQAQEVVEGEEDDEELGWARLKACWAAAYESTCTKLYQLGIQDKR